MFESLDEWWNEQPTKWYRSELGYMPKGDYDVIETEEADEDPVEEKGATGIRCNPHSRGEFITTPLPDIMIRRSA
jgi:hypothetical protein